MLQYIVPIIATVLLFFILVLVPLKIETKLLLKTAVLALLIVVLSYLLYLLYSTFVALGGFVFLLICFSFLLSKQIGYAGNRNKPYFTPIDVKTSKKSVETKPIQVKKVAEASFSRLDQESIDALLKAVAVEEVVSNNQENSSKEGNNEIKTEKNNTEIVFDVAATKDNEQELKNFVNESLPIIEKIEEASDHETEEQLDSEIEKAIEDFLNERQPMEIESEEDDNEVEDENEDNNDEDEENALAPRTEIDDTKEKIISPIELYEIGVEEEKLEEIFENQSRSFILTSDEEEKEVEADPSLVIYDRGLIDELEIVTKTDEKEVENKPSLSKEETPLSDKNKILEKRSRLFEQLEEDL